MQPVFSTAMMPNFDTKERPGDALDAINVDLSADNSTDHDLEKSVLHEKDRLQQSPTTEAGQMVASITEGQASDAPSEEKIDDESGETAAATLTQSDTANTLKAAKHASWTLNKKASFWDYFRPISAQSQRGEKETSDPTAPDANKDGQAPADPKVDDNGSASAEHAIVTSTDDGQDSSRSDKAAVSTTTAKAPLKRQASLINFAMAMPWNQRARRNTDAASRPADAPMTTAAASIPQAVHNVMHRAMTIDDAKHVSDTAGHVPLIVLRQQMDNTTHQIHQYDADGHLLVEQSIRFADARHRIKTIAAEEPIALQELALDLEEAYRQQLDKVTILHAQLETVHWRQHDLQDENRHLHAQLAHLSEQLCTKEHEMDALRRTIAVLSASENNSQQPEASRSTDVAAQAMDDGQQDSQAPSSHPTVEVHSPCSTTDGIQEAITPSAMTKGGQDVASAPGADAVTEKTPDRPVREGLRDTGIDAADDEAVLFSAKILSANALSPALTLAQRQSHPPNAVPPP